MKYSLAGVCFGGSKGVLEVASLGTTHRRIENAAGYLFQSLVMGASALIEDCLAPRGCFGQTQAYGQGLKAVIVGNALPTARAFLHRPVLSLCWFLVREQCRIALLVGTLLGEETIPLKQTLEQPIPLSHVERSRNERASAAQRERL